MSSRLRVRRATRSTSRSVASGTTQVPSSLPHATSASAATIRARSAHQAWRMRTRHWAILYAGAELSSSAENINNGTSNRPANCAATACRRVISSSTTSPSAYMSGGNPNLKPETSDLPTVGGVFTPHWIPGLSLSIDYYKIIVNDVITSPSVQDVLDACYDLPSIDNPVLRSIQRNPGPGNGPSSEIPGRILENSLALVPLNFAKLKVRGIDVEAAYRTDLGNIGRLDSRFIYTYAMQNDQFLDPTNPEFADQNLLELGDPEDALNRQRSPSSMASSPSAIRCATSAGCC